MGNLFGKKKVSRITEHDKAVLYVLNSSMPRCISRSIAEKICFVNNTRKSTLAAALYDSILDEDLNEVEFLLEKKRADPNYLLLELGITPIHCAVGSGSEDHAFKVVSFCIFYGGDPNVRCSEGATPVLIAALWGRLQILKLLLAHGGNPLLIDDEGQSALDYAIQNNHTSVLLYLKRYGSNEHVVYGPPVISQTDAVTQTSIRPVESLKSESSSSEAIDSFVSCEELPLKYSSVPKQNFSFINDFNQSVIGNKKPSFDLEHSKIFHASPEFHNESDLNSTTAIQKDKQSGSSLEKGFMCDSVSDLFSDIDSNIDVLQTVSIYNTDENSVNCFNSLIPQISSDSLHSNHIKLDKNLNHNSSKSAFDDTFFSISNNRSSHCDIKDVAFSGKLPEENKIPEEELYTDDEAGIVLLQRKFPPGLSDSDSIVSLKKSVTSNNSNCSGESYDTDNLANKLRECKLFNGPITKTTKKVYTRQLRRFIKFENCVNDDVCNFGVGSVLARTFSDHYLKLIEQWSPLEIQMSEDFIHNSSRNKFRGGAAKCFFNYLLMDPGVTNKLPMQASSMHYLEVWKTFIQAIFYVGKGKQSRPYAHLYEALKPRSRKPLSKKVIKVLDIWKNKQGVVCLMIFHNIISAEALTREAAMIDTLVGGNLTNVQGGEYLGIAATWNMKQKSQLGAVLLHRALSIYLAEGERQISPPDLEARPYVSR